MPIQASNGASSRYALRSLVADGVNDVYTRVFCRSRRSRGNFYSGNWYNALDIAGTRQAVCEYAHGVPRLVPVVAGTPLPETTILCMEATGVYGEALAYHLAERYSVAIEPPLKVKSAFPTSGPETDAVNSEHIAEYACRYQDELTLWQPPTETSIIEPTMNGKSLKANPRN